jgi:DUF1009 family protein
MPAEQQIQASIFERHIQTGIQVLLVALVLWAGQQLVATGNRVVSLEVQVSALQKIMNRQESLYYTIRDSERDFGYVSRMLGECRDNANALRERVNQIDERLKNAEVMR